MTRSLGVIEQATGRYFAPAYVATYVLKADIDSALKKLRASVDSGRRWEWWLLERDPIYAPLWDEPEFKAILEEIRIYMADQLEQVAAMERNGDLKPVAELIGDAARALQRSERL